MSPKKSVGIFDFWPVPVTIARNKFLYKSLSSWACNISIGCSHACRFCYVPSTATNKQAKGLRKFKIKNPDLEWGNYSLLRPWDNNKFRKSLQDAEKIPASELNQDGNRAIIFCSTTDPFQVFHAETPEKTRSLNESAGQLVRNSLEMIRDESTLNVRILTRSPMAREYFDLFKSFGNRLVFGMSVPTLDDKLRQVYEPKAPGIQVRLNALRQAKEAGLSVFIAMAPTYPECDEDDVRKTLLALKEFDPITIYHEPINIRAENVARIASQAKLLGVKLRTEVFKDKIAWRVYALNSLIQVQRLAEEVGLLHCLHLWPDKTLQSPSYFLKIRQLSRKGMRLTALEKRQYKENDQQIYKNEFLPWIQWWWSRVSEWPGECPTDGEWHPPKSIERILFPEKLPPLSKLSPAKWKEKQDCETIIENGWQTVLAVGLALLQIRDNELYKDEYATFEDYCGEKWTFTKTHANRMIGAGKVAQILTPIGAKCKYKESQLRPLVPIVVWGHDKMVDENIVAEKIKAAWQKAETLAENGQVTAKHVQKGVLEFLPPDHDKSQPPQAKQPKAKNDGLELFELLDKAETAAKADDMTAVIKILAKLRKGLAEY